MSKTIKQLQGIHSVDEQSQTKNPFDGSRRDFLRTLGVAAATVALAPLVAGCDSEKSLKELQAMTEEERYRYWMALKEKQSAGDPEWMKTGKLSEGKNSAEGQLYAEAAIEIPWKERFVTSLDNLNDDQKKMLKNRKHTAKIKKRKLVRVKGKILPRYKLVVVGTRDFYDWEVKRGMLKKKWFGKGHPEFRDEKGKPTCVIDTHPLSMNVLTPKQQQRSLSMPKKDPDTGEWIDGDTVVRLKTYSGNSGVAPSLKLSKSAANALIKANIELVERKILTTVTLAEAKAGVIGIPISSCYRSDCFQAKARFEKNNQGLLRKRTGAPVDRPGGIGGHSMCQAIDVRWHDIKPKGKRPAVKEVLIAHGWYDTTKKDKWHFAYGISEKSRNKPEKL